MREEERRVRLTDTQLKIACMITAFQYASAENIGEDDAMRLAQRIYGIKKSELSQ